MSVAEQSHQNPADKTPKKKSKHSPVEQNTSATNGTALPTAAEAEKQRRKQEKRLLKQQQQQQQQQVLPPTANGHVATTSEEERKQEKLRRKEERRRQKELVAASNGHENGIAANGNGVHLTPEQEEAHRKEEKKRRKQERRAQEATAAAVVSMPVTEQNPLSKEERKALKKLKKANANGATNGHANGNGNGVVATQEQNGEKKKKQKKQQEENGHVNGNNNNNGNVNQNGTNECKLVNNNKSNSNNTTSSSSSSLPNKSSTFYTEHPAIAAMTQEAVDAYRKELALTVSGPDAGIRPIKTFAQAGFPEAIQRCVAKFEKPTAIQAQCWPPMLLGRDVIGIAKTGSGKTLGFMLPAYVKILDAIKRGTAPSGPLCLVLAPTRELALQSAKVCEAMESETHIKTVCIYGGVDSHEQVSLLRQGARIVIATPGRLIGLLEEGRCNLSSVNYAVLDEADRMLDLGFEPDVRTIMSKVSPNRQTLLFSATWPASVQKLGHEFVKNPFHVLVGSEQLTANHDVAQIVEVTDEASGPKDKRLLEIMKQYYNKQLKNRILVFVLYKKDVPRVERLLQERGYGCGSISSDHTQQNRIKALEAFRDGSRPVLVGTDVASRGLDIPDVSHVINYSFPLTIEDYIHRIGRTGRSGKKGVSHTFFSKFDKGLAGELVNVLNEAKAEVPADLLKFGTGVKRKEHAMYGLHYKSLGDAPMAASKRVVFT